MQDADRKRSNLELARLLIPPRGNNWGEIAHNEAAKAEFLARVRPLVHEDYETIWRHSREGSETRAGLDAMMEALQLIGPSFESLVAIPERYVDLGNRVLVLLRREGRTVDGVDFSEEGALIFGFEANLLKRMEMYADRKIALTDAQISAVEAQERGVPAGLARQR